MSVSFLATHTICMICILCKLYQSSTIAAINIVERGKKNVFQDLDGSADIKSGGTRKGGWGFSVWASFSMSNFLKEI